MLLLTLFSCSESKDSSESSTGPTSTSEVEISDRVSTFAHFSELEKHDASFEIVNGDFETGDLSGWYKQKEEDPFNICPDAVDIWKNNVVKHGNYFMGYGESNYTGEEESKTGRIRSSLFKLGGAGRITFSLAGSNQQDLACYLMQFNDGKEDTAITKFNNTRFGIGGLSGFIMVPYCINVPNEYQGQLLYLLLEDEATSGFAFISIDHIQTYYTDAKPVFVSEAASYVDVAAKAEILQDATIESITVQNSGRRYFKLGQSFSSDSLIVLANYSDGYQAILPASAYSVNWSAFKCNAPGAYTIEIAAKGFFATTAYDVAVLPEGQNMPGTSTISSSDTLLVFGDSQMAFWSNVKADLGTFDNVINIGVGGTQTKYWIENIDTIAKYKPTHLLVNIGGNDIRNSGLTPEEVRDNVKTLLGLIKQKLPTAIVYLYSPSFGPASYYNFASKFLKLCEYYYQLQQECDNLVFIDITSFMLDSGGVPDSSYFKASDHLHYLPEAYKILAREFDKYVIKS